MNKITETILLVFLVSMSVMSGMFIENEAQVVDNLKTSNGYTQLSKTISLDYKRQEFWEGLALPNHNLTYQRPYGDVRIFDVDVASLGYTGSMKPTLYGGNIVLTQPYYSKEWSVNDTEPGCEGLSVGQIIIFDSEHGFIAHRIIELTHPGEVKTRGDNNARAEFVRCEDIKFIVVGVLYT